MVTYGPVGNWSDLHNFTVTIETNLSQQDSFNRSILAESVHLYTLPYRIVAAVFSFIILIVGLAGNLMVVIVVCRIRSMRTPTNCYLVSLACADILVLVSATLPHAGVLCVPSIRVDEFALGHAMCSITVFLNYLGINVSSLSITAFTIERHIAICHPMKAQTMCTVRRAKRIILGLWIFGLCYCSPWLALTKITREPVVDGSYVEYCDFKLERKNYLVLFMADLVLFYVVPLILTSVLYGLIGRILFSSTLLSRNPGKANGDTRTRSPMSSRIQVIKMLAVVVGLFAVLWLPYRAWVVYNSFSKAPYHDMWFRLLCRLMVYMNSAINPILYNAMSVKFRRAFKRLLTCGRVTENMAKSYVHTYTEVPLDTVHNRRAKPARPNHATHVIINNKRDLNGTDTSSV